jgi:hypothetical protein
VFPGNGPVTSPYLQQRKRPQLSSIEDSLKSWLNFSAKRHEKRLLEVAMEESGENWRQEGHQRCTGWINSVYYWFDIRVDPDKKK